MAQNRPEEVVEFFGSGLVGFGSCQVGFEFITGEEKWPDLVRSGQNLAGPGKISSDNGEISPDLVGKS